MKPRENMENIERKNSVSTGRYAQANGLNIYYEEHGQGTPMILLHGSFDCTGAMWAAQVPIFAKHFRVIVPDARGHGRTNNPADKITPALLAEDVMAFSKAIGLDLPILCGISMGGRTALEAAMRYPGSFRALVAGAAQAHCPFPESMQNQLKSIGITGPGKINPEVLESIDPQRVALLRIRHPQSPDQWKALLRQLSYAWNPPLRTADDYRKINMPALIVVGDRDHLVRLEDILEMYRALPNAVLAVLPGHDHTSFFIGNKNPFNALVLNFLLK